MTELLNRVREKTSTTGTGTISLDLGVVTAAFLTAVEAGAVDGHVYDWVVEENNDFEEFTGTFHTGTPPTVSRDTTLKSKISGTAGASHLSLLGNATVRVIMSADNSLTKSQVVGRIIALS